MLAVTPVLLLILTVILVWFFALVKLRPGTLWLIVAIAVSLAWGLMILVGIRLPQPIIIDQWLPPPHNFSSLVFTYTPHNWAIGFLIVSLLMAVIFSEAKYLDTPDYIRKISGSILLTAISLLAIMSGSLLSFVIAWALIDLIEFGVLAVLMGQPRTLVSAATSIFFRVVGLLLLILFISITPAEGLGADPIGVIQPFYGLIVLLVLFRTGTLPLFQPYVKAPDYQRGIVTILRVIPLAMTYAFIQYISDPMGGMIIGEFWLAIVGIAMLWGAVSWFTAIDELHGRPYLLFAMAGFGLTVLMTGKIEALPGLAVVLIAGGGGLFLYSPRLNKFNPFIAILIAGMLSIPFTPSAPLSRLLIGEGSVLAKALWILGLAFLVAGLVKHNLERIEHTHPLEPWMRLFHSAALYFIAVAPWVLVVVLRAQQAQYIQWWPWISIAVLCAFIIGAFVMLRSKLGFALSQHRRINQVVETTTGALGGLLRFTWLSRIFSSLGFIIAKMVNVLARVMEGDGGILWSFLFFVLLLSLLLVRQAP